MTDFAHATLVRCPDCGMQFCPEEGHCPDCSDRQEPEPEPITAFDHLERCGNVADAALSRYHTAPYADRINMLIESLHLISQERIEYVNRIS